MRSFLVPAVLGLGLVGMMPRALSAAPPEPLPATIHVQLPADAKLTIDGAATKSTSAERSFITPPLEPGKAFTYTFQAEFAHGNQTIRVTQQVPIRAGQNKVITLGLPPTSVQYPRQEYFYGPASRVGATAGRSYSGPRDRFRQMREDEDSVRD